MIISDLKVRQLIIFIVGLILLFFIPSLASSGLPFVEYHGSIFYLYALEEHELHCVQKSLGRGQGILGLLKSIPPFICFDTIAEADAWMNRQLER